MKSYAVAWLGSRPDREEVARRVSPLTYVREGLLTIHGDDAVGGSGQWRELQ